jgi:4-amino-4-deoxy-L-arabinose transferase-like glycosyltransferase
MRQRIKPQKITMLALTLLAFLLRAYRLDFQSYWIDEAWTVYFARLSFAELWRLLQVTEIMPPIYHPSTISYIKLFGDSEYALRFYSLVFGVMAVPFTYRLGQDLGSHRLGLAAALLMTVAPYQVWHSQEARMYSMLTAASVMSMWGFVNLMQRGGRRWWLVYLVGTEWAIMTHYHGAIVIGVQGLFLLLTWRRHWRRYLGWAATLLLMFGLYLPWLAFGGSLLQSYTNWIPQAGLMEALARSAKAYSVGELMPPGPALWPVLVFVAFFCLGLIYAARRRWGAWRGPEMAGLLLAYTLAPHIAAWLFGEFRTPVYLERYMIAVQPGFLLTVACGVLALANTLTKIWLPQQTTLKSTSPLFLRSPAPRLLIIVPLLPLLVINAWVLYHHYTDPAYAKEDWRAVARTVTAFGLPGDAVLLTGDGGEHAFNYYYRGGLPVHDNFNLLPPLHPDYKKGRTGPAHAPAIMENLAAANQRLWYTPYGVEIDPLLESWLAQNAYPAWHGWLGRKRLALYRLQATLDRQESVNAAFAPAGGSGPVLVSAALPAAPTAAGDALPMELTWQTAAPLPADYELSVRLVNGRGDIFTQSDWPPLAAAGSASTWPANQPILDRRSLWLPADTPPGQYGLQLVVYHPATGQPLGQPAAISNIAVAAAAITPPPAALSIPNFTSTQNSKLKTQNLSLVGYVLPNTLQPGQGLWLWLYWQATAPVEPAAVRLTLAGQTNTATADFPLAESLGRLDSWQPGQVRRAVYYLPTGPRLDGRAAQLTVSLLNAAGQVQAETSLAEVSLQTRPHNFEPSAVSHPTGFAWGEPPLIKLIGFDLPQSAFKPGDSLPLTLVWQAQAEMAVDYTVFVQLLNPAGQVAAQIDRQPLAGAAPTTGWLPNEILTDPYTLPLPPTLPSGPYRLITGLYHAATGQRLPVAGGADFVELAPVTVQ